MMMVMVGPLAPLAPWASGMAERLTTLGYTPRVAELHMRLARGLSRFLQQRGVTAEELSPELISRFLGTVRWSGRRPTPKMLAWMVDYLRDVGVAQEPIVRQPRSEQQLLVERYREYLMVERGLEPCTIANYGRVVTLFLTVHAGRGLDELTAADISRFMTSRCQQISVRAAERLATGLRSFLGFALVEGLISAPLTGAVPSVARWSGAGLPRGLTSKQVAALLASCDRRRAFGRRDYAILVLLVRLGLRAAEVSALRLDDIDWRAGEIVVRGKGRTEERLPLPADVGTAIAAYLRRGRPRRPEREVFLRACAPLRGLTPDGVGEVVRAASERAGRSMRSPTTPDAAMHDDIAATDEPITTRQALRASSPPQQAPGCCATTSAPCSRAWCATRASPARAQTGLLGFTTCVIRRTAGLCALPWRFRW